MRFLENDNITNSLLHKLNESENVPYITSATADYSGGGIYIYTGKLSDGNYFTTTSDWDSTLIVDSNPDVEEAGYEDWQRDHLVKELTGNDHKTFMNQFYNKIISDSPEGNYQIEDLKHLKNKLNESEETVREEDNYKLIEDNYDDYFAITPRGFKISADEWDESNIEDFFNFVVRNDKLIKDISLTNGNYHNNVDSIFGELIDGTKFDYVTEDGNITYFNSEIPINEYIVDIYNIDGQFDDNKDWSPEIDSKYKKYEINSLELDVKDFPNYLNTIWDILQENNKYHYKYD